jgi:ferredoxin/flavodoxin---NADP+ reductase
VSTQGQPHEHLAPSVAVIGSGPSGCYTAQFLRKELPDAEITIFEALPVPYGLVRYGVAADHQGTKAVAAQFDRMFERANITFVGNTRIGTDIPLEAVNAAFDVVVIATGLTADRQLSVPRDDAANIIGAGQILRALNAFPGLADVSEGPLSQPLGDELIVVGHGNVAIDVVRLLTKPTTHFSGSDIHDDALDVLRPGAPTTVHIVGRSAAENAKFDLAMLRELCSLDNLRLGVEGLDENEAGPVADLLRHAVGAARPVCDAPTTAVTFHFRTVPTAVRAHGARTVLEVIDAAGSRRRYPVDTVITAIGFCHSDVATEKWSGAGIYRVGWLERGGRGNIAENRKHAQQTAKAVVADLVSGALPLRDTAGLAGVLPEIHSPTVDFSGWKAIDGAERGAADERRCRRKITDIDQMITIARTASRVNDDVQVPRVPATTILKEQHTS